MQWNQTVLLFLLGVSLLVCSGCRKPFRPEGLPELTPCSITIIDIDGAPLAGASVSLVSTDEEIPWSAIGITDQKGIAKIAVNAKYDGVPAGKYRVLVYKQIGFTKSEGIPKYPPNVFVSVKDEIAFFINPKYSNKEKTPFEIEIANGVALQKTFNINTAAKAR